MIAVKRSLVWFCGVGAWLHNKCCKSEYSKRTRSQIEVNMTLTIPDQPFLMYAVTLTREEVSMTWLPSLLLSVQSQTMLISCASPWVPLRDRCKATSRSTCSPDYFQEAHYLRVAVVGVCCQKHAASCHVIFLICLKNENVKIWHTSPRNYIVFHLRFTEDVVSNTWYIYIHTYIQKIYTLTHMYKK